MAGRVWWVKPGRLMGRTVMYLIIGALVGFVLIATFILDHGGGYTEAVSEVSVHDLLSLPERHRGHDVTTEGVLKFDSTTGGYLVTADGQGIIVRSPDAGLRMMQDSPVRVTGRFDWTPDEGVYIEAAAITLIPE